MARSAAPGPGHRFLLNLDQHGAVAQLHAETGSRAKLEAALLRQGLEGAARTRHIQEITGEFIAIDAALARLEPGDLCLVLVDQVEEALAHLAKRVAEPVV